MVASWRIIPCHEKQGFIINDKVAEIWQDVPEWYWERESLQDLVGGNESELYSKLQVIFEGTISSFVGQVPIVFRRGNMFL